jgi:hypothetical protein
MESERDAALHAREIIDRTQRTVMRRDPTRWLFVGYALLFSAMTLLVSYGPRWVAGVMVLAVIAYDRGVVRVAEQRAGIENQRLWGRPGLLAVTLLWLGAATAAVLMGAAFTDATNDRGWVGGVCAAVAFVLVAGYGLALPALRRSRL